MSKNFTELVYTKTWTSCGWGGLLLKYQKDTVGVIWFARSGCTGSTPKSVHVRVCVCVCVRAHARVRMCVCASKIFHIQPPTEQFQSEISANKHLLTCRVIDADQTVFCLQRLAALLLHDHAVHPSHLNPFA